jgi:hypothetical protein
MFAKLSQIKEVLASDQEIVILMGWTLGGEIGGDSDGRKSENVQDFHETDTCVSTGSA